MKFFIDANLPYSSKEIFEKFGKTWHTRDANLSSASDVEVFDYAVKKKAILVTRDLEFCNPYLYPLKIYYGLIILRIPSNFTVREINKTFRKFLFSINVKNLKKTITIVEPDRIRVRKL